MRVAGRRRPVEKRELGRMGLPDDDGARCAQPRDDLRVDARTAATFSRLRLPARVGQPATSITSFTATGMPCSGPRAGEEPQPRRLRARALIGRQSASPGRMARPASIRPARAPATVRGIDAAARHFVAQRDDRAGIGDKVLSSLALLSHGSFARIDGSSLHRLAAIPIVWRNSCLPRRETGSLSLPLGRCVCLSVSMSGCSDRSYRSSKPEA